MLEQPCYPFKWISADFFEVKGKGFLVIIDRYSSWPIVYQFHKATSSELVKAVRKVFETYGVAEKITSDGGGPFVGEEFTTFLKKWGVTQHQTSAYTPHSNLKAESAVRSVKKIVSENMGVNGSLEVDRFSLALLNYRNTPCRFLNQSPAQILYARALKDALPKPLEALQLRPEWIKTKQQREIALARKHVSEIESWSRGTRKLESLCEGDLVMLQNKVGKNKKKWEISGVIVKALDNESYLIKLDGSGRLSKRRRHDIKKIMPFKPNMNLSDTTKFCSSGPTTRSRSNRANNV